MRNIVQPKSPIPNSETMMNRFYLREKQSLWEENVRDFFFFLVYIYIFRAAIFFSVTLHVALIFLIFHSLLT